MGEFCDKIKKVFRRPFKTGKGTSGESSQHECHNRQRMLCRKLKDCLKKCFKRKRQKEPLQHEECKNRQRTLCQKLKDLFKRKRQTETSSESILREESYNRLSEELVDDTQPAGQTCCREKDISAGPSYYQEQDLSGDFTIH